ncbi:hypothetical protein Trydic_g16931 [Trypoxylus dichotomus]
MERNFPSNKKEKPAREAPEAQPGTSHSKATGVKRNLSDGSTPKAAVKRPKTNIETEKSYSRALTDIRMAIVPENYPESSIFQEQAELIRNCILQELGKLNVGAPEPKFSEVRHRAGMLRAACVDAGTCSWLAGVVRNCALWDGAKLKLVREDDLPKPIKALVWIPGPQMESHQILHRFKVQNQKLPMSSWRVVSTKADPKGQQMVVAMDESSWKVLQNTYHGRLYLQFSSVSFRLLGRKTKEQAKARERMDTIVAWSRHPICQLRSRVGVMGLDRLWTLRGTAPTITDLLESQMVDPLRAPPSEGMATAALQAFVVNKNIDIVLIQEPWIIKGKVCGLTIGGWTLVHGLDPNPRPCLLVKRNLNFLMLRDHCPRDLTTVKIQWMHNSGTRDLLLGSAYLPYVQEGPPPTSEGSTDTNKRGESLISHFVTNGLVTLNRGNKPTFVTVSRAEVIDVTVCTPRFARWVKQWHVSDEPSLSDQDSILNCHRRIKTAVDIELLAESLQSAIITSYEASCPVKIRSTHRDTPWKRFCQELEAVPECSRIRKVLAREGPSRIGTLSKSDGTKAETEEQVLQHLLEVQLPGSEIIQTQFGGECKGLSPQIPDSRARRVD